MLDIVFLIGITVFSLQAKAPALACLSFANVVISAGIIILAIMGFSQPVLISTLVLILFLLPGMGVAFTNKKLRQSSEDIKPKFEEIRDMFAFVFFLYALPALLAGIWYALGGKVATMLSVVAMVPVFIWIGITTRREEKVAAPSVA